MRRNVSPVLAFLLVACGSGGSGQKCVTGQNIACTCSNGASGSQTCLSDGTYGSCSCTQPMPDGGTPVKRVFVTHTQYIGDLRVEGSASDGPTGADRVCATAAQAATLGGTWRAWLSDSATNAIDRVADVSPWYLIDGKTKVFNNKANLATSPAVAIQMDETGVLVAATDNVWTGTSTGGTKATTPSLDFCRNASGADWADNTLDGLVGSASGTTTWTSATQVSCNTGAHIYCFEQ